MSVQSTQSLPNLFHRYVHLRQTGRSMDEVVNELQDAAYQLPREERKQLGQLVSEWEDKYGHQAVQAPPPPKPEPIKPAITPVQQLPAQTPSSAPFGTRFLDPSKLQGIIRTIEQPVACARCGRPNQKSASVCQHCGYTLAQ